MENQQNQNESADGRSDLTDVLADWRIDEFGQPTTPHGWGLALLTPNGGYMTLPPRMAKKIVDSLSAN